jgi:Uma2 family endonuclease
MIRSAYRPDFSILGPEHAGLRLSAREFDEAEVAEGYRAELVDGVVQLSPSADAPYQFIAVRIFRLLDAYRPKAGESGFALVLTDPRVFVTSKRRATIPQPDVAAYTDAPRGVPEDYRDLHPALVVEVVSRGSADKDFRRNLDLYQRVPQILEYWIVDARRSKLQPALTVHHRRRGVDAFTRLDVPRGTVYESKRWPGLRVDWKRILAR